MKEIIEGLKSIDWYRLEFNKREALGIFGRGIFCGFVLAFVIVKVVLATH